MLVFTNPVRDDAGAGHPRRSWCCRASTSAAACASSARASQDRVADSSAIAAEVLERHSGRAELHRRSARGGALRRRTEPPSTSARERSSRMRAWLVAFIITATFGALLWGLYQGTQAVMRGDISAGHLGADGGLRDHLGRRVAVLSEVYGDLLRAAGATERLMELLVARSPVRDPIAAAARCRRRAAARRCALRRRDASTTRRGRSSRRSHDFSLEVRAGRDGGAGRPERRRQEHGVPAAAALLRRRSRATSRIDGVPVAALALTDLRQRIGIVPQDSVIFSTSALENIRYGRPDASDDEVDGGGARRPSRTSSSSPCPRATTPTSASAACACRAASASASASRAPC